MAKFALECFSVLLQVLVQLLVAFFLMGFKTNFFAFLALNFMLAIASTSIGIFIGSCVENPAVAAEMMPALIGLSSHLIVYTVSLPALTLMISLFLIKYSASATVFWILHSNKPYSKILAMGAVL